ncbi:MAG: ATP-binding cassette domain-containing protein, partial [Anaerolineales bacterium]|nr:ATP-binding cassette domain-containing protein [Anaerolineales bacterium]
MSRIIFNQVKKSYGDQPVLKDFSMTVESGMGKVILGGGGSGKSTILKMIPGLILPDSGSVFIDKNEISALTEDE